MNTISSLLNFIGGKISDAQSPTIINVSDRNSKCTSGICSLEYDKVSQLVQIYLHANTDGTSNLGIDEAVFTIPQAYRPPAQKSGSCVCWNPSSNQMYASTMRVETTGEVVQRATSNCSRLFGYIAYKL